MRMKGILTGALTSASVVISLTAFAPLAYATNVTSVEISLDMPKAGEELSSQPEIVAVTPSEAQGSLSITNVVWKGADLESGAKSGTYDLTFDKGMNDVLQKPVKNPGEAGSKSTLHGHAYYPASMEYGFLTRSKGGGLSYVPGYEFMRTGTEAAGPEARQVIIDTAAKELINEWTKG